MQNRFTITDAEWEIMNVLWARSPLSAADIVSELEQKKGWKQRTTRTLLDRLVAKNILKAKHDGKRKRYQPAIKRTDCLRQESQSFLNRVFGGEPASMLSYLVQESNLSKQDIQQLRRILKEKEK